jgi:hypothetical protein
MNLWEKFLAMRAINQQASRNAEQRLQRAEELLAEVRAVKRMLPVATVRRLPGGVERITTLRRPYNYDVYLN